MKTAKQYSTYKKPSWAPPSWLFGPVWTLLYLLIAISFGYVGILYFHHVIPFLVAIPFILNLIFNFAYTPLQFRFHSFVAATIDVVLVLITLVWALYAIYPYAAWVSYSNLPYVAWVCFASILQITVTVLNRKVS